MCKQLLYFDFIFPHDVFILFDYGTLPSLPDVEHWWNSGDQPPSYLFFNFEGVSHLNIFLTTFDYLLIMNKKQNEVTIVKEQFIVYHFPLTNFMILLI